MNFVEFFTETSGHAPYDYQQRLACGERAEGEAVSSWLEHGASADSRLISIPTGLGKTAAMVQGVMQG